MKRIETLTSSVSVAIRRLRTSTFEASSTGQLQLGGVAMTKTFSKSSPLPAISVGLAISILVATWVAGARFERMERADTQAITEITSVAERQRRYIGTTGVLTEKLNAIDKKLTDLETKLALLEMQLETYIGRRE